VANFVVVVDPDPTRRAEYLRHAAESLGVLPTLREGRCVAGAFAAAWAAPEQAPVSMLADGEDAAVVWGQPLTSTGAHADAKHLRDARRQDGMLLFAEAFDGFFAAVRYSRDRLIAGADLLGLFPVYYWAVDDVVLVASSIRAFRAHPLFRAAFNPIGAAGLLLTGGLLDGETLWRDVRRLSPGYILSWSRESGAREVLQFRVPTEESLADRPFEEHVALLDEVLDVTLARHVAVEGETSLLLSGGRDSRVVAGLMRRRGHTAHAVTLGEPQDYDVECAAAVANTLGFTHTIAPDPLEEVAELVRHHVRVEQLANGLANFYTWGMGPSLDSKARVLSGYRIEDFIGGTARALPGAPGDGSAPDRVVRKLTSYGVGPDHLRRLARHDVFGTAVDDCLERLRARFAATAGDDDRRSWQLDMDHRRRFHAGSTPWRLSLSAWPLMLALDQRLVTFCASLPASTLLGRRAEDELLRTKFPALAQLPLDRNSHEIEPLLPSAAWRIRRSVVERAPFVDRVVRRLRTRAGERRRYYRLYDINSPMWRTVRHMAEPNRGRAADVLDTRELAALLPTPDSTIELRDTITDSNGLKALLGFLIWWSENG
jgi:asparagine synthase (glutamine-hydrolysing)